MTTPRLFMWVVYKPPEGQRSYQAVRWVVDPEPHVDPSAFNLMVGTLDMIRGELAHLGLTPLGRNDNDDPAIVETWI